MPFIRIHQEKATDKAALLGVCPFGAIEISGSELAIGAGCRMCRQCVRKHGDVFEFVDDSAPGVDKSLWRGIAVVAEIEDGALHPVSLELLGKARELAAKINHPVYAVAIGPARGGSLSDRVAAFSKGAGERNVLLMLWIFILAGAFAGSAKAIGAVDATVGITLRLLPGKIGMGMVEMG